MTAIDRIADRHRSAPGNLHRCHGHAGPGWYPYAGKPCDANLLLETLDEIATATHRPYPKSTLDSNGRLAFVHRLAIAGGKS